MRARPRAIRLSLAMRASEGHATGVVSRVGTGEPGKTGLTSGASSPPVTSLPDPPAPDIHKESTTLFGGAAFVGRIGHFSVRRVISTGPTGTIYEAEQDHPRRLVSLKVMVPGPEHGAVARQRFDEEAQILAGLHHPAIAQVYEAGVLNVAGEGGGAVSVPYFAMEYVPSTRTLTQHARDRGLTIAQRLELCAEVCDAVQHAHHRGIIHRAIRPANILIDAGGRPKIIDFGFTRALSVERAGDIHPAGDPESVESLFFVAPELLRRDPTEPDARADVYSLGVLLYDLLAGRLPWDPEDIGTRDEGPTRALASTEPTRPSTLNHDLRGDAETIILTAMHRDLARRYRSAGDVAADIHRYLQSRPIAARRDSIGYVLRTMFAAAVARHPVPATLVAAGAAWLVATWPGPQLVFTWTPLGIWFERAAEALAPAPMHAPLSRVRLIAITDGTDMEALAAAAGIAGVRNDQPRSFRALHGVLMERLAESSGARVVVWDINFPSPQPGDSAFAAGVGALQKAGIPVIVGIHPWTLDPSAEPGIAPVILASGVRWGGASISGDEATPWKLDVIAWRADAEPQPSLVLEALAASQHPDAEGVYRVDTGRGQVEIRYRAPRPGSTRRHEVGRARVTIGAVDLMDEAKQGQGLRQGDGCGSLVLRIPDDASLRAATIPYEEAFRAGPDERRALLGGAAVVLANLRDRSDYSTLPDGRTISRAYAHLAALDALMGGPIIRLPRPWHVGVLVLAAALVGATIPWRVRSRTARGGVLMFAGAAMLTASLLAFGYAQYLCNPLVPLLSLLAAAAAAAWVVRARDSRDLRTH